MWLFSLRLFHCISISLIMNPFILLVCFLSVFADAYSEPGAWERLFYYYSYLADVAISGGKHPSKIAIGCSRHLDRKCTFNEFIKFIDGSKAEDKAKLDFNITPDERPDLRATAQKLIDRKITGTLNVNSIMKPFKDGQGEFEKFEYYELINKVGKFTGYVVTQTEDELLQQSCRDSCNAVLTLRQQASLEVVEGKYKGQFPDIELQYKSLELYPGAADGYSSLKFTVLDIQKTVKQNPTKKSEMKSIMDEVVDFNHEQNIYFAKKALKEITKRIDETCS